MSNPRPRPNWPLFISGLLLVLFGGTVAISIDEYFGLLIIGAGVALIIVS